MRSNTSVVLGDVRSLRSVIVSVLPGLLQKLEIIEENLVKEPVTVTTGTQTDEPTDNETTADLEDTMATQTVADAAAFALPRSDLQCKEEDAESATCDNTVRVSTRWPDAGTQRQQHHVTVKQEPIDISSAIETEPFVATGMYNDGDAAMCSQNFALHDGIAIPPLRTTYDEASAESVDFMDDLMANDNGAVASTSQPSEPRDKNQCRFCDRILFDCSTRLRHERRIHALGGKARPRQDRKYPCSFCGLQFNSARARRRHCAEKCVAGRLVVCEQCNDSYRMGEMQRHMQNCRAAQRGGTSQVGLQHASLSALLGHH